MPPRAGITDNFGRAMRLRDSIFDASSPTLAVTKLCTIVLQPSV